MHQLSRTSRVTNATCNMTTLHTTHYVHKLSIWAFCTIIFRSYLTSHTHSIKYFTATTAASVLLDVLSGLLSRFSIRLSLARISLDDLEGIPPTSPARLDRLQEVGSLVENTAAGIGNDSLSPQATSIMRVGLPRRIARAYLCGYCESKLRRPALELIFIVEAIQSADDNAHIIYWCPDDWTYKRLIARHHYSSSQLDVQYHPKLPLLTDALSLTRQLLSLGVSSIRQSYKEICSSDDDVREAHGTAVQPTAKIAVEYCNGIDSTAGSDLPCDNIANLRDKPLVVYNKGRRAFSEHKRTIRNLGAEWIDFSRPSDARLRTPTIDDLWPLLRQLATAVKGYLSSPTHRHAWLLLRRIDLEIRATSWRSFFRRVGIQTHLHRGASYHSVAATLAIDRLSGTDIAYQWSTSDHLLAGTSRVVAQQYYLCWSEMFVTLSRSRHCSRPGKHLTTGYIGSVRNIRLQAVADHQGKSANNGNGDELTIAVFDSSFAPDSHFTQDLMRWFYTVFVRIATEFQGISLTIKPKNADTIQRLGLSGQLALLEQRGKCSVMSAYRTPEEALQYSDIAVGVGLNTAIVQTIMCGRLSFFVDPIGMYQLLPHDYRSPQLKELILRSEDEVRKLFGRISTDGLPRQRIESLRDSMKGWRSILGDPSQRPGAGTVTVSDFAFNR